MKFFIRFLYSQLQRDRNGQTYINMYTRPYLHDIKDVYAFFPIFLLKIARSGLQT